MKSTLSLRAESPRFVNRGRPPTAGDSALTSGEEDARRLASATRFAKRMDARWQQEPEFRVPRSELRLMGRPDFQSLDAHWAPEPSLETSTCRRARRFEEEEQRSDADAPACRPPTRRFMGSEFQPRHRGAAWGRRCALGILLAVLVVGGTGCFRVGKDASALRKSVAQALSTELDPKFEFSVGALTMGLVRGGLALAEVDMPPEAHAGLGAFHAAEVGVYTLHHTEQAMNPAAVLSTTDTAMRNRGWDRMVGVVDHDNLVAVYVPAKIGKGTTFRACVLVIDGRDVVVASAQGDPGRLVALAMEQAKREHPELLARAPQER